MHRALIRAIWAGGILVGALTSQAAGIDRAGAESVLQKAWSERSGSLKAERGPEVDAKTIEISGRRLRWEERVFGEAPAGGRSLWISMHGGGGAPPAVNDQQWTNQIGLYQPGEGIYLAPRAPTDTWNLWHEAHIDLLFDRLIEDFTVLRGVDPNKVYIMGYSAGGDGVWQLAPRMADRWAAAAMMAGHPNEASILPLRNLPFALFVGAKDTAYGRAKIVETRAAQLDILAEFDPGSYPHFARVYPEFGHWMNRKDAEALPWMAKQTRNPWPKKIVWLQDDVTHTRFYWLSVPAAEAKARRRIDAVVEGQEIRISGDVPKGLALRLSDALVDLDQPIRVRVGDREVFNGPVPREEAVIRNSLAERADPASAATARLELTW